MPFGRARELSAFVQRVREAERERKIFDLPARRFVLGSLAPNDPARQSVQTSMGDLAAEMLDPGARAARELGRMTVPELLVHLKRRGMELQPGESMDRATLIAKLTNTERAVRLNPPDSLTEWLREAAEPAPD